MGERYHLRPDRLWRRGGWYNPLMKKTPPAPPPEAAPPPPVDSFQELGLADPLLRSLVEVGYEAPTPIQAIAIPPLLAGRDLIGQAQTGTGKTAAFGLALLQAIEPAEKAVQALVLTPTRELAIQVAEALHTYGKYLQRLVVLPVYGGQSLEQQQRRLDRGVHVVVGTPGRIMDHLRRGSLKLDRIRMVVLDEADEMLRMGFIEDVEWILSQAPPPSAGRQTALFSATMPPEIRRIAQRHLQDPMSIELERKALTVPAIDQRYILVAQPQKLEALTRLLETEPIEAVLVFTRTKNAAAEVSEKLEARGYSVAALHGDMNQPMRERVVERLRAGQVEIVVATDVAARGIDVDRISHVVNYDIPYDLGAYIHRIGRTGRAGRAGSAVLFVTPRERRMLQELERYTGQRIQAMRMPTAADVALRRSEMFKETLRKTIGEQDLDLYLALVEELVEEGLDLAVVAAAAAYLARRERPLELAVEPETSGFLPSADGGMVRLFLNAGRQAGVRPADIVGAIANEAGVPGKEIGSIDIDERYSFVEVPARYHQQIVERMAGATLRGRPLEIRIAGEAEKRPAGPPRRPTAPPARGAKRPERPGPPRGPKGAGKGPGPKRSRWP